MSFFADAAPDEPPEPEPAEPNPWDGPPQGEVGAVLPVSALLGSTANAALLLSWVRLFRSGIELHLEARVRRGDLGEDDWEDLLERARGFGIRMRQRAGHREPRVGLELADGTRVIADDDRTDRGAERATPRLRSTGGTGSGSDRSWTAQWTFWLWPLPPDGPLTVVVAWPGVDIGESRVALDGSGFAAAAARSRPIWPDGEPGLPGGRSSWTVSSGG